MRTWRRAPARATAIDHRSRCSPEFAAPPSTNSREATTEVAARDAGEPVEAEIAEVARAPETPPSRLKPRLPRLQVAAIDAAEPWKPVAEAAEVAAIDAPSPEAGSPRSRVAAIDAAEPARKRRSPRLPRSLPATPASRLKRRLPRLPRSVPATSLNGEDDLTAITGIGPGHCPPAPVTTG